MHDKQIGFYGFFQDSWLRDVHEELLDCMEEDTDNRSFIDSDDDETFTSDQRQENISPTANRCKVDSGFTTLYEMLENEDNNETIEAHIRVNLLDTLLAVLTFAIVCNLTSSGVADCFKMINCIFGCTLFPSTRYLINKIFDSSSGM